MTIHPFAEVSEDQAKFYMPDLKQFDTKLFEPIRDYESKLYVEIVEGHRNQSQKISWRLLPSGSVLAIARWPVDNWMGHFELKRKYSCTEVPGRTIQAADANTSAPDASEFLLEEFNHFRKVTIYTNNRETNTLIAFNEKNMGNFFHFR